jgi:hypothetical protein
MSATLSKCDNFATLMASGDRMAFADIVLVSRVTNDPASRSAGRRDRFALCHINLLRKIVVDFCVACAVIFRRRISASRICLEALNTPEFQMTERHFPSPWSAEQWATCFVVSDAQRQPIAHVYFADDPTRRAAAKLLAFDEAKQIAENIARLPGLLHKRSANAQ